MQIQVENISLKQKDFSFFIKKWTVESQAHWLIEGPSGCGKTSFLHLLAGLLSPTSGRIILDDQEITKLKKTQLCEFRRKSLGIIFQKIHLLPHLNLLENILLGSQNNNSKAKALSEAQALIEQLEIQTCMSKTSRELSLGETQRASIARALISNPKLILADEPTASLDDKNAENVFQLLKEKAAGKTLLIVTHDHRARAHFDKVLNFKELLST